MQGLNRLISVASITVHLEDATRNVITTITLEYYLHHSLSPDNEDQYGLRVDKTNHAGSVTDSAETPAFTNSLSKAINLAERFAAGTVMPCVLQELTDEWKDEIVETYPAV